MLLPSPFSANQELNEEGLCRNVCFLRDHDVPILCVACGVRGSQSLSEDEAARITMIAKEEAGAGAIVVAGIGDPNLRRARAGAG